MSYEVPGEEALKVEEERRDLRERTDEIMKDEI